jgi:hypothetical protein
LVVVQMAALAIGSSASPAHADDAKRALPDYDGRGNEDANAGSWALWIPRVALSPLYFLNEFVLRRPIGALVTVAERRHWVSSVVEIFTFGRNDQYMLVPTALFDFGLLPSVGVYYAGDDTFVRGNATRLHAATWGADWLNATALDRYSSGGTTVAARVEFKRQADLLFFGTGPDVTSATRARYGLQRFETAATFSRRLWGESSLVLSSGAHTISYRAGNCCGDPSLDQLIADGTLAVPSGYGMPYTTLFERAELTLDTRPPRPGSSTGGYLQMHVEPNFDVRDDRSWLKFGSVVGMSVDLDDRQRTLKVQVAVDYADPMRGVVVPFNELPALGSDLMPGFVAGWMAGRSTFATQLAYAWPVWMWLDGRMRFGVGNAFDGRLHGLAPSRLRMSADIGLTSVGRRDQGFEMLFGVGTETFEHGSGITSVRFSVGSRRGF